MMDIIEITDSERWDGIVTSFAQYDVYYLSGYVKGFRLHGDGEPELMYYDSESLRAIYVYMKRAVAIAGLMPLRPMVMEECCLRATPRRRI